MTTIIFSALPIVPKVEGRDRYFPACRLEDFEVQQREWASSSTEIICRNKQCRVQIAKLKFKINIKI